jgi:sodium/bile acid cotransporter 7
VNAVVRRAVAAVATEWFLAGMIAVVAVASVAPHVGRSGGLLRLDAVADWGVVAVFFLHGVGLSTDAASAGPGPVARAPHRAGLHVRHLPRDLAADGPHRGRLAASRPDAGIPVISARCRPTVSSSVAMTALARGNVAASIFNATLSILLGVVLTPLLVSLLVGYSGGGCRWATPS